jgi:ATP-dependent RNA helicase DHX29
MLTVATNIAETGVTIPDVTCVIDTGKHREMRYVQDHGLGLMSDTTKGARYLVWWKHTSHRTTQNRGEVVQAESKKD